ncbi:GFA family protein [Ruegeria halocynthiae]|uniref:GFA family protein n=1 Tax=Ruegeria halocynthiae TaxID=985054 RepID=UPI00055CAC64|nr:GFA family protein [Ruegeria halocynthiae]
MQGHCLCGTIRYEIDPPVLPCVTCHCDSCRRQCAAPMTAYFGVRDGQWRWLGETPKTFNSSPGVERSFCPNCGTPISFRSQSMSDVLHLYVATLDDPEMAKPTLHVAHEEKLGWLKLDDGLPCCIGPDYTKYQPLPKA